MLLYGSIRRCARLLVDLVFILMHNPSGLMSSANLSMSGLISELQMIL